MSENKDLSKLEGERNPFNKYEKKHARLKAWLIVIASLIVMAILFFFAKSLLTYTLSFDTLGGSEIESQELTFLEIMKVPTETPKKSGYYLAGWTKDKDGNEPFPFGEKIWWSTKAYAKWEDGVALVLEFAEGEETADLSLAELKDTYEHWLKPGSTSALPLVENQNENSIHYAEVLLWFETPQCDGEPIYYGTTYASLTESKTFYGKWFDKRPEQFEIDENGVLINYKGYCRNLILPNTIKAIRGIDSDNFLASSDDHINTEKENQSVFKNVMSSMESVYLNSGLEVIGECAFRSCSKLSRVEFLNGANNSQLKTIGGYAFDGTKLSSFDIPDKTESIGEFAFHNLDTLTSITIGTGVKTIGQYAFINANIKSLTLNGVESLGKLAFGSCNKLEKVYLLSKKKINVVGVEEGVKKDNVLYSSGAWNNFKIYIPKDLMESYLNDKFWNEYKDYFDEYGN